MAINANETSAHTTWNCKYHIVFAPKFRRQIIYGKIKEDIGKILRTLCERKGIEILQATLCPDHVHMLLSISLKYSVADVMSYLRGKSSLMIFDRFAHLKYKYGNRKFWCRGYYVDTVGRNEKKRVIYTRDQLNEDKLTDQLRLKELTAPFKGLSVQETK
ncbi:MAG: IS200/IS605 family transposase [Pyramidobacter sp.]|jgi:putative transposase